MCDPDRGKHWFEYKDGKLAVRCQCGKKTRGQME